MRGYVKVIFKILIISICSYVTSCTPKPPVGFLENGVVVKPVDVEFVFIPGSVFEMGHEGEQTNELPAHKVVIHSFYMSRTEITQQQWLKVMPENPSFNINCDMCPVEQVTFSDVQEYIDKASRLTGVKLRLPTEAEWEYAASGGAAQQKYAGTNQKILLGQYAWYSSVSEKQTHPAGTKLPNLFGLFDMSGNVWEWCNDWYEEDYYSNSPHENPAGPLNGTYKVIKGGSFNSNSSSTRTARRVSGITHTPDKTTGFRIVTDAF